MKGERGQIFIEWHRMTKRAVLLTTIFMAILILLYSSWEERAEQIQRQQETIEAMEQELADARQVKAMMLRYGVVDHRIYRAIMDQQFLPPVMCAKIIEIESEFQVFAVSRCGARGLMQIHPCHGQHSTFEVEANINYGCSLFREYLNRYKAVPLAIQAYNMGENTIGKPPCAETLAYIQKFGKWEVQL